MYKLLISHANPKNNAESDWCHSPAWVAVLISLCVCQCHLMLKRDSETECSKDCLIYNHNISVCKGLVLLYCIVIFVGYYVEFLWINILHINTIFGLLNGVSLLAQMTALMILKATESTKSNNVFNSVFYYCTATPLKKSLFTEVKGRVALLVGNTLLFSETIVSINITLTKIKYKNLHLLLFICNNYGYSSQ